MGNFSLVKDAGVRMAVLEEKLSVYEELSREMLAKLESAVDKISEANQNVAKILVRHEERLDQSLQSDASIIRLIEELREQNKIEFKRVDDEMLSLKASIDNANAKIADISRFRWVFAGALLILTFIISESKVLEKLFSEQIQPDPAPQLISPQR